MADQKYQAIIFDLDGTAVPTGLDGKPSQRLIEAVKKAQSSSSLKLCGATGRSTIYAEPVFKALGLTDPCIVAAGTQIINPTTGKVLWQETILQADVAAILRICTPYDYRVVMGNVADDGSKPAAQLTANPNVNVMYVLGCNQADTEILLKALAEIPDIVAVDTLSWEEGAYADIHITPKTATKEHAVAELLKIINVSKEAAIGVGDGNNDVHLFRAVGYKIAMDNATDLLKSQADEVCASVEEDGLAKVVEQFTKNE